MRYRCIICNNQKEIVDHLHVRQEVFVREIDIPVNYESDEHDKTATLFLVYNDQDIPIGAGRFREIDQTTGKIERVCVIKKYRNQGIGELIMKTIEQYASEKTNVAELLLGAQLRAFSFYKRLKYEPYGDMYFEVGIEHKRMKKVVHKTEKL